MEKNPIPMKRKQKKSKKHLERSDSIRKWRKNVRRKTHEKKGQKKARQKKSNFYSLF